VGGGGGGGWVGGGFLGWKKKKINNSPKRNQQKKEEAPEALPTAKGKRRKSFPAQKAPSLHEGRYGLLLRKFSRGENCRGHKRGSLSTLIRAKNSHAEGKITQRSKGDAERKGKNGAQHPLENFSLRERYHSG